jgi:hypothetical protein
VFNKAADEDLAEIGDKLAAGLPEGDSETDDSEEAITDFLFDVDQFDQKETTNE